MQRFVRKGMRRGALRFERLEDRLPLAGNVTADFDVAGNLSIDGDGAENSFVILMEADEIVVRGVNTTINGLAEVSFDATGGVGDIAIDLGEARTRPRDPRGLVGVDTVEINGIDLAGNLTVIGEHGGVVTLQGVNAAGSGEITLGAGISATIPRTRVKSGSVVNAVDSSFAGLAITTGASNDVVTLVDTAIGGDLNVNTAAGADVVTLTTLDVDGTMSLDTAAGSDQVVATDLTVDGVVTVNTGADVDTVNISSVELRTTFLDDVFIDLGTGRFNQLALVGNLPDGDGDPDTILGLEIAGSLTIDALGSVNVIALAGVEVGVDVTATTGNGVDVFAATRLNVQGNLSVNTAGGSDVVLLGSIRDVNGENSVGGATTIDTGSGNDVVVLAHTTFEGPVDVNLGSGNDVLVIFECTFNDAVTVDGGLGRNTAVFDASFDAGPASASVGFRSRSTPNVFNRLLVDLLLARANNWLDGIFQ